MSMTLERATAALNDLVDAWEMLRGGTGHSADAIEAWLSDDMAPAINKARRVLGRKKPNGEEP